MVVKLSVHIAHFPVVLRGKYLAEAHRALLRGRLALPAQSKVRVEISPRNVRFSRELEGVTNEATTTFLAPTFVYRAAVHELLLTELDHLASFDCVHAF